MQGDKGSPVEKMTEKDISIAMFILFVESR
jgi:hypothetical protein